MNIITSSPTETSEHDVHIPEGGPNQCDQERSHINILYKPHEALYFISLASVLKQNEICALASRIWAGTK